VKKIILFTFFLFLLGSSFACNLTSVTTETVPSTDTTFTTTLDSTVTSTLDLSSVDVLAYSSNSTNEFTDISSNVSSWNEGSSSTLKINVDDLQTFQTFYGTGAALTYSSAYVINQSPSRSDIINYLFSKSGLHIQLVRLTIGASDFVTSEVGHYTYDDTVGNVTDPTLEQFSLQKDQIILDILQEALTINPDIVFMAAPWSAPAWMKTNKSLYGGILKTDFYSAYADYLVRYLTEMNNLGIHIKYLSIQNEPYYAPGDYPGMTWTIDTTKVFIRDFLGPKLGQSGLDTGLMIWDHNAVDNSGTLIDFPVRVLRNVETASYVTAIGVHCYTGDENDMADYLNYLHENNPETEVFMTECTAVTTYKNLESNMEWSIRRMYTEAYNRYASGTTYWNMALDPNGQTHLGGCDTCTGLISVPLDGQTGFTLEADGYVTGHFSKDIQSGSKRIYVKANNTSILATGFVDSLGKITIIVFNDGAEKKTSIVWRNSTFTITLPKNSLTTITWNIPL
jgi:glucosylceramidase